MLHMFIVFLVFFLSILVGEEMLYPIRQVAPSTSSGGLGPGMCHGVPVVKERG